MPVASVQAKKVYPVIDVRMPAGIRLRLKVYSGYLRAILSSRSALSKALGMLDGEWLQRHPDRNPAQDRLVSVLVPLSQVMIVGSSDPAVSPWQLLCGNAAFALPASVVVKVASAFDIALVMKKTLDRDNLIEKASHLEQEEGSVVEARHGLRRLMMLDRCYDPQCADRTWFRVRLYRTRAWRSLPAPSAPPIARILVSPENLKLDASNDFSGSPWRLRCSTAAVSIPEADVLNVADMFDIPVGSVGESFDTYEIQANVSGKPVSGKPVPGKPVSGEGISGVQSPAATAPAGSKAGKRQATKGPTQEQQASPAAPAGEAK